MTPLLILSLLKGAVEVVSKPSAMKENLIARPSTGWGAALIALGFPLLSHADIQQQYIGIAVCVLGGGLVLFRRAEQKEK